MILCLGYFTIAWNKLEAINFLTYFVSNELKAKGETQKLLSLILKYFPDWQLNNAASDIKLPASLLTALNQLNLYCFRKVQISTLSSLISVPQLR